MTRLRVRTDEPVTLDQLHLFDGDRHNTRVTKHGPHDLTVTLEVNSAETLAAATRAVSYVLRRIPGRIVKLRAEESEA